jgi:hypothetical protein
LTTRAIKKRESVSSGLTEESLCGASTDKSNKIGSKILGYAQSIPKVLHSAAHILVCVCVRVPTQTLKFMTAVICDWPLYPALAEN